MSRWRYRMVLITTSLMMAGAVNAQSVFSGRMIYAITYLNLPDDWEGSELFLPNKCTVLTDGKNWRMTQFGGVDHQFEWIYRAEEDSLFAAVDLGVDRVIMPWSMGASIIDIPYRNTSERSKIAGQPCVKYEGKTADNHSIELWLLDEYSKISGLFSAKLGQLPAVFYVEHMGAMVRYELKVLKAEWLDQTYFVVPEHYRTVSAEEYKRWLR